MTPLEALAADLGVALAFHDFGGVERRAPPETLRAVLAAMGLTVADDREAAEALAARRAAAAERLAPPSLVIEAGAPAEIGFARAAEWRLAAEGEAAPRAEGRGEAAALPALPPGFHRLDLAAEGRTERVHLLAAPRHAPSVAELTGRARLWGATAPLWGLASPRNAGFGDYEDLGALAAALGAEGAAFLGVNPVHAPGAAAHDDVLSPYSPSDRGFLDPRHIPVGGAGGEGELADRAGAAPAVRAALAGRIAAHEALPPEHPERARLAAFRAARGAPLEHFLRFEALSEIHGPDWRSWPTLLRDPDGPAALRFAADNPAALRRHALLQMWADEALGAAQARAKAGGMALGLFLDLAVGPRPGGSETWGSAAHAHGVSMGAPPDAFAPSGQNWGLAPLSPEGLRAEGAATLARLIDAAARHAGMVRIDHVLGFGRAFWAPDDGSPGAYVAMPLDLLLAAAKIVAHRRRVVIVGEDLGLVEPSLRHALAEAGLYGMDVLQFDPKAGRERALAAFSTHDTPTVAGFFAGRDLDWRERLGHAAPEATAGARIHRAAWRDSLGENPVGAIHRRLAESPAALAAVQLEDLAGALEQQNLPGTVHEHPNWRRRLTVPVEGWAGAPSLKETAALMAEAGRCGKEEPR